MSSFIGAFAASLWIHLHHWINMKEELARELAQHIIHEKKIGDRMIFPINGSQELIIVTVVKTYYDPRVVNTQFLHLNGKTCPTCGGRGHV